MKFAWQFNIARVWSIQLEPKGKRWGIESGASHELKRVVLLKAKKLNKMDKLLCYIGIVYTWYAVL